MPTTTAQAANARTIREQYEQDLQLTLDAFERDLKSRLPKYADAVMRRVDDNVQKPLTAFFARVEAIKTSGRYTLDGERTELQLAAQGVRDQHAALRRDTVDKLDAQLDDVRAAAVRPKVPADPVSAMLRELRLRELRDELRRVAPLAVRGQIRMAIESGANSDLVDALDGAPTGFPIVPPEVVRDARMAISERNDPKIGELAQLRRAYDYILGVAEQLLQSTGASGADGGAPTDGRQPYILSNGKSAVQPTKVK